MISKKILYSEQLLQLVLALSLLQVDPINYLEWGVSRIHSDDASSPWQLEMAQTMFSDQPYMNRKTYVPLIEDLARYDHMRNHGLQTYLLNLSDDPIPPLSNNITNLILSNNTTTTPSSENASAATNLVNLLQESSNFDDIFLQSDLLSANAESIIDQNLADLNDYEDHQHSNLLVVPTKNEVFDQDSWLELRLHDVDVQTTTTTTNTSQTNENQMSVIEMNVNDTTTYTRSTIIDWSDYLPIVNDSFSDERKITKEKDEKSADLAKERKLDDVGEVEGNNEPAITASSVELTVEVSRKNK